MRTQSGKQVPSEFCKPPKDKEKQLVLIPKNDPMKFQLSSEQQVISKMHTGRAQQAERQNEDAESEESK